MTELLKEPWPTYSRLMQGKRGEREKRRICVKTERERDQNKYVKKRDWDRDEREAQTCTGRQSERENENVFPSRPINQE